MTVGTDMTEQPNDTDNRPRAPWRVVAQPDNITALVIDTPSDPTTVADAVRFATRNNSTGNPHEVHATVALNTLITSDEAMTSTLASGRMSLTPDTPVDLCLVEGSVTQFEVVDGHHRLAQALREGRTRIPAVIRPYHDDEPYQPPFYRFPPPWTRSSGPSSEADHDRG